MCFYYTDKILHDFSNTLNLVVNLPLLQKGSSIKKLLQPKTMQLTTNKLLRVFFRGLKPVLSGSFSFLRTVNPGSLNIFQNQIANSASLGKTIQNQKNPSKTSKEPQFS
jgi:hypothetical protein